MSKDEILYCLKGAWELSTTKYGITAWLVFTIILGVIALAMRGWKFLKRILIRLVIATFAFTYGMTIDIIAYLCDSKILAYIGFFFMVVPVLIVEVLMLIKDRIIKRVSASKIE